MKNALKNMTLDQLRQERDRLDDQRSALDRQYDALEARWDEKSVLLDGWHKRMNKISHRILEIAKGAEAMAGEVDDLFERQDKLFARYEMRTQERRQINGAMQVIDKEIDRLYRRLSRIHMRMHALRAPVAA
ncbi:hypothetical protein GCM10007989_13400 [Devosia pacifica]|uniref:Uncharacterized protein n=1 Tax=Devosia pacifica TaxID=1335967 RepID=A0A918S1H6_9HYPH|nr:hypothetical protein [Devosia pacifica]GHA19228.1 hypothetical protein GCM10007989_13400 [Devosia pacifica]